MNIHNPIPPLPIFQYMRTSIDNAVPIPRNIMTPSHHINVKQPDYDHENSINHRGDASYGDSSSKGNTAKKRKKAGSQSVQGEVRVKKTRQSQSCDTCRARKVRCDRPPPGAVFDGPTKDICSHCAQLNLPCTFEYVPRKRGPPNMYLKRLQKDQSMMENIKNTCASSQDSVPSSYTEAAKANIPLSGAQEQLDQGADLLNVTQMMPSSRSSSWQPSPAMTIPSSGLVPSVQQYPPSTRIPLFARNSSASQIQLIPSTATSPIHSRNQISQPLNHSLSLPSSQPLSTQSSLLHAPQRLTYIHHTHNPQNPLDSIVPRPLLYSIIDLYFDYIYCLVPCPHKPTFIHNLNKKREEESGQEEWAALVLAIVGITLLQLPKNLIDMPRGAAKNLALRCHEEIREYLAKDFQIMTITRTIILYHSLFMYSVTSRLNMSKVEFGTNYACLLALNASRESNHVEIDPVERTLRKRIFWLMYGVDKTFAAVDGTPVYFHEDDYANVTLPDDIEDEFLSQEGAVMQPDGYTSVLCGFRYISQLHRLAGEVLDKRRRDKLKAPSGLLLQMRLNEINNLYHRTMTIMDDCPPMLRLNYGSYDDSIIPLSSPWNEQVKSDIHTMFLNRKGSTTEKKDFYLVQQANIYVTQQVVRFTIIQYREKLLEIHNEAKENGVQSDQQYGTRHSIRERSQEERYEVVIDTLTILQKIMIKVFAVNNLSIVIKVRSLVSTLLDYMSKGDERSSPGPLNLLVSTTQRASAEKAQKNLWRFSGFLSEIESMYCWVEEEMST
ncbi:uncharacterized protein L203_101002 [Cryptococcus depauperatus CBS 7841]|uniref:Zn(2)-C6 fungal-type domain-containing protein n=1 Tax=Cryptococcus depauperatus CBS 7841 TaxID=1295531 RepID=A0AAJ8JP30_9TREE